MNNGQRVLKDVIEDAIRVWKHGEFPMPDWVPQHMAGGIEANGTFALKTELGYVRVHPGNIVIEHYGAVWVRTIDEASDFIKNLRMIAEPTIANIGPGKARQFGTRKYTKRGAKNNHHKSERGLRYSPAVGSQPSIEWIQLPRLSVDSSY